MPRPTKEFMEIARCVTRAVIELDRTASALAADGYFKNAAGIFWNTAKFDELCSLYVKAISLAPDAAESNAARYSLAGLLRSGLRLDEAAKNSEFLIQSRPKRCYADQSMLALIEARRGNIERARELAAAVNGNPEATSFRVSDADLQREYEAGTSDRS